CWDWAGCWRSAGRRRWCCSAARTSADDVLESDYAALEGPGHPTADGPADRGGPAGVGAAGRAVVVGASGPRGLHPGRARLAGADAGHVGPVLLAAGGTRAGAGARGGGGGGDG